MQVIKYKWQDFRPQLIVRDGGETSRIELLGNDVSFNIGKKMCTGYTRNGKSYACRNQRASEDGICNECKLEDDYFFCIRCTGAECINEKKRAECKKSHYYIYLAAFDSLLKVGISHERRIMERLVEQGADFGAKIARVQDGKLVRSMEQEIKKEVNITDRVTGQQKHRMLFGNPNTCVSNIFRAISILKSNGFAKHITATEIYDLREHYNLDNVVSQPRETEVSDGMRLDGRIVSAKGNLLIFRDDKSFFSVNAHQLLGREITGIAI